MPRGKKGQQKVQIEKKMTVLWLSRSLLLYDVQCPLKNTVSLFPNNVTCLHLHNRKHSEQHILYVSAAEGLL